ncbi:MAG: hemerythrin domain-containing protein [Candidatus Contendobacter sp.]|nr:hemerythrin domain-containing protein [Candidatus Contendobacter sp.]MDG4559250.1 hemerythrin domain-containing protein [Candidatus Contendobacter sp.]
MTTIAEFLANEHRGCDEGFTAAEEAAQAGDPARCRADFQRFQAAMERHFQKEETMLFPAFEQATGNAMGPTRVMRLEHQQMRETFAEIDGVLANGDLEEFLGQAETLLILMQQHNIKEEQILYPMCDRFLGDAVETVIQAMRNLPGG